MIRGPMIAITALLLAGCAAKGPASVAGGECRIFERPQYEVRGKRPYDQDWIDSQIEGGVGGCRWQRPAKRPASLDAAPAARPAVAAPKRKPGLVKRIRDRILPPAAAAPSPPAFPAVAAPIEPVPPPPAPAPPKPRAPVDELLDPVPAARREGG